MATMLREEKKYLLPKIPRLPYKYKLESELLDDIKKYLKAFDEPIFYRRVEGSGKLICGIMAKSEMSGFPDLIIIKEGQFYGCELKLPGKYLTEKQAKTLTEIVNNGASQAGIVCSLAGFKRIISDEKHDAEIETDYGNVRVWR